jgi:type VI secretion system secreted protein VgrG
VADNRYLRIESPESLAKKFSLLSFSGHEEMSRLFAFQLEAESADHAVDPKQVIGQQLTFSINYYDEAGKSQQRFFNGYVNRLSAGGSESGYRRYNIEVVPWLWFLTRKSDCRIFSEKKVPDILDEVFKECPFKHTIEPKIQSGNYNKWVYCVQYRETDFNFVSRLMEQEGIFYYFRHTKDDHVLVLCDRSSHYEASGKKVKHEYTFAGDAKQDHITDWVRQYQFVSGAFSQTDYEFEKYPPGGNKHPDQALLKQKSAKGKAAEFPNAAKHVLFDYPAEIETVEDADTSTDRYIEEEVVGADVANGSSNSHFFSPGIKFEFVIDQIKDKNAAEKGNYVLLSVQHSAGGAPGNYRNSFNVIPADVNFRPARATRKPAIHGSQTAVVVGPSGSEINTDEFGRVQVQFFWDRKSARDQSGDKQQKPVWIRVAQVAAGKKWGAMFIPRVGQEVVVSFLEGDPDRPLVTGAVYNNDQMPPYPLDKGGIDENKTKSYIKTNSSSGGEGYNEIQFDDKAGKEMLYFHAQRNMDVRIRNDSLERIYGNRHQIIGWKNSEGGDEPEAKTAGDQRELVYGQKHLMVRKNQEEQIGGDMKLLIGGGDEGEGNLDVVIKGTKKEAIEKDNHVHIKGKRSEKVDTDQSLTVGSNQQEKVGMKHALEAGQEIHLKSGLKIIIEAGVQLTLKGPGGFVDIGPAGVTIQGTLVNINSGGAAGSGSGSSPSAPEDAKEAQPKEPEKAHQDKPKSGQKSTPY